MRHVQDTDYALAHRQLHGGGCDLLLHQVEADAGRVVEQQVGARGGCASGRRRFSTRFRTAAVACDAPPPAAHALSSSWSNSTGISACSWSAAALSSAMLIASPAAASAAISATGQHRDSGFASALRRAGAARAHGKRAAADCRRTHVTHEACHVLSCAEDGAKTLRAASTSRAAARRAPLRTARVPTRVHGCMPGWREPTWRGCACATAHALRRHDRPPTEGSPARAVCGCGARPSARPGAPSAQRAPRPRDLQHATRRGARP
jgi:hypothetical protein